MKGDFIAELGALPKNWQRKAEKVPINKREIGKSAGVYNFSCPISELPTLVIITEDNEVFRITEQNVVEHVFKYS